MRKQLIRLVLIVAGIILLWFLFQYFTTGKLEITSSNPAATITLTKIGGAQPIKSGTGSLSIKLKTGEYVALAEGNSQGVSQVVKVKGHQTNKYALNPPAATGVAPVVGISGSYIAAGNHLIFLNGDTQKLNEVNGQNGLIVLDGGVSFISARWASSSQGVAEDSAGHLYSISNSVINQLKLPVTAIGSYDIAASGDIYFSAGKDIYKGSSAGDFTKLYTSKESFSSLAASQNGVALVNTPSADDPNSPQGYISMINAAGKVVKKINGGYSAAAWSPSGKYLAAAGNLDYKILDGSLETVADIPNTAISNPLWLSDDTLAYSVKDQLWTFNVSSGRSSLIANMPLGAVISQLSLSDDKSYIYTSVAGLNGAEGSIKRVGLKGQTVPELAYQLQDVLPINTEVCTFKLISFGSPSILVGSVSPDQSQYCLGAARLELTQDGFKTSQLKFQLSQ